MSFSSLRQSLEAYTPKTSPLYSPQNSISPDTPGSKNFFDCSKVPNQNSSIWSNSDSFLSADSCDNEIPSLSNLSISGSRASSEQNEVVSDSSDFSSIFSQDLKGKRCSSPSILAPGSGRPRNIWGSQTGLAPGQGRPISRQNAFMSVNTCTMLKNDEHVYDDYVNRQCEKVLKEYQRGSKPWMTEDIMRRIDERDSLFVEMKENPHDQELPKKYKKARNIVVTLTRRAKRDFVNKNLKPTIEISFGLDSTTNTQQPQPMQQQRQFVNTLSESSHQASPLFRAGYDTGAMGYINSPPGLSLQSKSPNTLGRFIFGTQTLSNRC